MMEIQQLPKTLKIPMEKLISLSTIYLKALQMLICKEFFQLLVILLMQKWWEIERLAELLLLQLLFLFNRIINIFLPSVTNQIKGF